MFIKLFNWVQKVHYIKFEKDQLLLESLTDYAKNNKIKTAEISFIGAVQNVNVMYMNQENKKYDKLPEYVLSGLWINYQKPNDFNPPHDHDGKLSFVTYLQIPEELKKENQAYKGRSCGPGGIQFIYGNGPRDCVTYMSFLPEENDMFIFPAWLKHWVAPYKSDCTRISVSGNVHDTAPLNNIKKFAPKYLESKTKSVNKEEEKYLEELKTKL